MKEKSQLICHIVTGLFTIVALIFTIIDIVGGASILDAFNMNMVLWGIVGFCVLVSIILWLLLKTKNKV